MDEILQSPLAIFIIILFGAALTTFLLSLHQLRRARVGPYWRLRRAAGQRGGQLFLIAVTLFGFAFALAFFSGWAAIVLPDVFAPRSLSATETASSANVEATVAAAINATLTALPTPANTEQMSEPETESPALPTEVIITPDTPTSRPTDTPSPTATSTPAPTATPAPPSAFQGLFRLTTPVVSGAPVPEDARLILVAAAADIDTEGDPVDERTAFEPDIQRIYFFFSHENMADSVPWTRILYHDGVPVYGRNSLWNGDADGEGFFYVGVSEGYPEGVYEMRLMIAGTEVSQLSFTVVGD